MSSSSSLLTPADQLYIDNYRKTFHVQSASVALDIPFGPNQIKGELRFDPPVISFLEDVERSNERRYYSLDATTATHPTPHPGSCEKIPTELFEMEID